MPNGLFYLCKLDSVRLLLQWGIQTRWRHCQSTLSKVADWQELLTCVGWLEPSGMLSSPLKGPKNFLGEGALVPHCQLAQLKFVVGADWKCIGEQATKPFVNEGLVLAESTLLPKTACAPTDVS